MTSSKRNFFLANAAAALLAMSGVQAQTALDYIMKAKEIKIAIPTDFPPYGMVGTDLKPQGLDVEMAGNMMAKNPRMNTEYKLPLSDSPNFIGVAKGEDKLRLKINEVIAKAKKNGDLDKLAVKWLGRPAGNLPQ